jgi:oxygen-dependent protoporphyrinogen oxidase
MPEPAIPLVRRHSTPHRIAIVGGGISGLAAAHRLRQVLPAAQVNLFEASSRLGGVLDTVERDGFLIERSADNFLTSPTAAVDLCRQLGLENELVPTDEARRRALVVQHGRLVPIPEAFYLMSPKKLGPILRSPLLSPLGKLRLLAEPLIPRGAAANLQPPPDESVASFVERRLGREVFERLVQPLVAGIYTADPAKLSMAATMPKFLEYERTYSSLLRATLNISPSTSNDDAERAATGARYNLFLAPKRGMQSIVQAIVVRLPADCIQRDTTITSATKTENGWTLNFDPQSAVRHSLPQAIRNPQPSFDALILAVPTFAAAKLLEFVDPALSSELSGIEYAGCAVVSLGFEREHIGGILDGFGFVVPAIELRRIIAASFSSFKFPGRAPNDDVLIRVFIGGAMQPELLDLPDAELRRIAIDELGDLLRITGIPLVTDIARWPRSMPQYNVGHLERVARIESLVARHPTLALIGNAYRGVGIPQCVAGAQAAADRIATVLRA